MATIADVLNMNTSFIATISNSITAHFTKIDNSVKTVNKRFVEFQNVTVNKIDIGGLKAATDQISQAADAFDIEGLKAATSQISKTAEAFGEIENSIKGALEQQKEFNGEANNVSVSEGPSIFSKIGDSTIFQNAKDALGDWIKSTDQYAAMQEKLKAMGTEWLSTDSGVKVTNAINNALNIMANVIEKVAAIALTLASAIVENWSWIAPIIFGIVGAIAAYGAALLITNGITAISKGLELAGAIAKGLFTSATLTQTLATQGVTMAQWGLNSALLANPIMWVVMGIIALIVIIYAVIGAINKFAGTSISATGVIAAIFTGLGATIYNVVASIWNYWASFIVFFVNVFNNPVYSIKMLFVNLANTVLDLVKSIASAIDAVFGTNLSGSVTNLQNQMQDWLGEKPEGYKIIQRMEMKSIEGSAKAGYDWGQEMSGKFNLKNMMNLNNFTKQPNIEDNIANTAVNTGRTADSIDMSSENLEYMRDIAEQEVVNRFATAEIKVDMTNHMAVNSEMDLDGVVTYLGEKLNQEMQIAAEGVHI
jgi:hypothetical protein